VKEELGNVMTGGYEKELRHLENEIRSHIKIEYQLKLHSDTLKSKVDELEKNASESKHKIISLQDQLSKLKEIKIELNSQDLIENLKKENLNLKLLMKSYEDRSAQFKEVEEKYREKQTKYEKELVELEAKYKEKIRYLTKKLSKYENPKTSSISPDDLVPKTAPITQRKMEEPIINEKKSRKENGRQYKEYLR